MRMDKKYRLAAAGYGILLTAFTVYVLLNSFVLSSPAQTGANQMNLSLFADETAQTAGSSAETQTGTAAASGENAGTSGTTSAASQAAGTPIPIGTAAPETEKTEADTKENTTQSAAHTEASTEPATDPVTDAPETDAPETAPPIEFISSDTVYQDENMCIALSEYNADDTVIYVADVTLSSAQYLKTAFADDTYGKNVTAHTSDIAEAHGAILAVNGDFYGSRDSGYVIRNGVLYRDNGSADTDVLCVMADGSFFITNSGEYSAQELLDMGAWQAFSFGPALVQGGGITVDAQTEVSRAMASNPRTALGIISDLHYVFVVSDGRTSESAGLSLYQLAEFMQGLGVQTAYNLDGGGSSTMYFNGAVINNPTTSGRSIKERSVSDIVYIGY